MLSVTNKEFMLSVVMMRVVMLNVMVPRQENYFNFQNTQSNFWCLQYLSGSHLSSKESCHPILKNIFIFATIVNLLGAEVRVALIQHAAKIWPHDLKVEIWNLNLKNQRWNLWRLSYLGGSPLSSKDYFHPLLKIYFYLPQLSSFLGAEICVALIQHASKISPLVFQIE